MPPVHPFHANDNGSSPTGEAPPSASVSFDQAPQMPLGPMGETLGIILCGIGLFMGLACYSFSPYDYTVRGLAEKVSNLAGPWGAVAAAQILGRLGVVGMIWPMVLVVCGILTTIGKMSLPHPKRILGMILLSLIGASFFHIFVRPTPHFPEPTFGYGGLLGQSVGGTLLRYLGPGGSLISLLSLALISLVSTENISLAKLALILKNIFSDIFYLIRRFLRRDMRHWTLRSLEWIADAALQSVDSLLKICLKKELYNRWTLYVNRQVRTSIGSEKAKVGGIEKISGKKSALAPDAISSELHPSTTSRGTSAGSQAQIRRDLLAQDLKPKNQVKFDLELYYDGPPHGRPEPHLFSRTVGSSKTASDYDIIAQELVRQLAEFRIFGEISGVTNGPVVTTFEFKPAAGTKVSKISAVGEDLARMLKASSLRVLAPIPGKDTVGFEVPNRPDERAIIGFSELLAAKEFHNPKRRLPIAMGVDIFGVPLIEDLADMPHLLVAGSTGSGKSVFMNTLIGSLVARHSAQSLRFVMIDPKMVELAAYNSLPHMACPVITDTSTEALFALSQMVEEMERRYRAMRALGVRSIEGFNEIIKTRRKAEFIDYEGPWLPLPYMVLIIDEMADMMMTLGRDAETPIARLAQKARAAGVHMVIATQRPSADVVTGLIKANFPTRIAFRVLSGIDSRTILDQVGAETLLGKGDMLYLASGGLKRLHGAYLSESEVHTMVKACKKKRP